jgi:hypothetical protein
VHGFSFDRHFVAMQFPRIRKRHPHHARVGDTATFVILLQLQDGVDNPLRAGRVQGAPDECEGLGCSPTDTGTTLRGRLL